MTGEEKSPENSSCLSVKRGAQLMSKSSKPSPDKALTNPPRAAIPACEAKNEERLRPRNFFNDFVPARDSQHGSPDVGCEEEASVAQEQQVRSNRVAELERALAVAKEEQDLLRKDLDAERAHRQADQNMIDKLRSQVAETRRTTRSPPAEHSTKKQRSSDHPDEDILRENYELRYTVAQLHDQITFQDSATDYSGLHTKEEWESLRSRLHVAEKESQERLQQLISLKKSISSLTRMGSHVTDTDLTEAFSQLFDRIRDWTVSNFKRSRLKLDGVPDETRNVLSAILPGSTSVASVDKLALYQAIVSHFCMRLLDEPLLVGLPDTAPLAAFRLCDQELRSSGSHREWQRATIRAIEQSNVGDMLRQGRDNLVHQIAREIEDVLCTVTSVDLKLGAKSALLSILITAADVQRMIALQKSHYQVLFFRRRDSECLLFDYRKMEVVNNFDDDLEDSHHFRKGVVLFCVSPCLEKIGNEEGENLENRNVLFKAKVCSVIDA
ncbi:hypothetical protein J1614_004696 [Plenodomus biglobosus]|nr:hypothetical protein J1614_004696 [Plenodomus biglobosus]